MNADIVYKQLEDRLEFAKEYILNATTGRELLEYSTELRYKQFEDGEISFEDLKKYAYKRTIKRYERERKEIDTRIQAIADTELPKFIEIRYWKRPCQRYGYTAHSEVTAYNSNGGVIAKSQDKASGYGYDKESTSVSYALLNNIGVYRAWYESEVGTVKDVHFSRGAGVEVIADELRAIGYVLTDKYIYDKDTDKGEVRILMFESQLI